jgi:hypothetical protein
MLIFIITTILIILATIKISLDVLYEIKTKNKND